VGSPMDDGELQIVSNDDQPLPMVKSGPFDGDGIFSAALFRNPEARPTGVSRRMFYSGDLGLQVLMDTSIWSGELLNSSTLVAYI